MAKDSEGHETFFAVPEMPWHPKCKNHPGRKGIAHYKGYSLCVECLDARLAIREDTLTGEEGEQG